MFEFSRESVAIVRIALSLFQFRKDPVSPKEGHKQGSFIDSPVRYLHIICPKQVEEHGKLIIDVLLLHEGPSLISFQVDQSTFLRISFNLHLHHVYFIPVQRTGL